MWIPINPMRYCIIDNLYIMVEFVGECLLAVSGCRIFWCSWLVRMQVSGSGCGNVFTVCIDWLITRQMYSHRQCTYSSCVHTDTPEVPPSRGWGRNFTVSCWVRSLRLQKIGHKTLMIRAEIFLAWALTLQSWAQHNLNTGTSINFAVKYLKQNTIQYGHHEQAWLSIITLSFLNVT